MGAPVSVITTADLIDTLDRGRSMPAMLRPCALLDAVLGSDTGGAPAQSLPVGQRDALLLELQQALFGPMLEALARCPHCAEWLELNLRVADLRVPEAAVQPVIDVESDGYRVRARLPDSRDLAAAAQAADVQGARDTLMQRCVLDASLCGNDVAPRELPQGMTDRLGEAMSAADPQANTELALQCPACAHAWTEPFDIGNYLMVSVEHWADRCLDQVDTLARAYGWSEAQIFALSPARRARYIERVLS